ncbi:hypothetical protein CK203_052932 [Vitis vinifera]|uniref:Uncharacterized protein n=1 Tax=Vitis vinifera TaxID=29760 RepID=A0A438GSZ3_VITVI|nr:hypothetical protein CK203_052932 [Vitis vinifera]
MDNEGLEGPFSKDEVAKALSELGGDKALGLEWVLDGFVEVFLAYSRWEVMQVLEEFHLQNAVMKRVIDKMVSNNQNVFVRARQILDATLVTNEEIDLRK